MTAAAATDKPTRTLIDILGHEPTPAPRPYRSHAARCASSGRSNQPGTRSISFRTITRYPSPSRSTHFGSTPAGIPRHGSHPA